uniref:hypothetical protein n=1 Tax=Ndongobacter massiliensis TaxID=1871025 RepID=UPI0009309536|nr:hypothetical protein [Ndongobacter massiliensis]
MNTLWTDFSIVQRVQLHEVFNSFLWLIRKLPFIGHFLGDSYRFFHLKRLMNFLRFPLYLLWSFFKSLLGRLLFMIFFAPTLLSPAIQWFHGNEFASPKLFYQSLQVSPQAFIYLSGGLFFCETLLVFLRCRPADEGDRIQKMVRTFRMNPIHLGRIFTEWEGPIFALLRFFVFALLYGVALGISIGSLFALACFLLFLEWTMNRFYMNFFLRHRYFLQNKWYFVLSCMTLALGGWALGIARPMPVDAILIGACLLMAIPGIWSMLSLRRFSGYPVLIRSIETEYARAVTSAKEAGASNVKLRDSDLKAHQDAQPSSDPARKHGFSLLNSLFFQRHRRILLRPQMLKTLFVIGGVLAFFIFQQTTPVSERSAVAARIPNLIPLLMMLVCSYDKVTKSMYVNCDHSLLHYQFYRRKKAQRRLFFARLRTLGRWSLYSILPITLAIAGFYFFGSWNFPPYFGIVLLLPAAYGLFFTVFHLSLYYLFQPYSEKGSIKSLTATFLQAAVSIFCYASITRMPSGKMFLIHGTLTLGGSLILVLLVFIFSQRTFRLRE